VKSSIHNPGRNFHYKIVYAELSCLLV